MGLSPAEAAPAYWSQHIVFNNSTGLYPKNDGTLYSYGTNSINGNTSNGSFTGTVGLQ